MSAGRKMARRNGSSGKKFTDPRTHIQLSNPVADQFAAFIFGNCATYQQRMGVDAPVVQENAYAGQRLILCGAGPSLAEHADEYCKGDTQIWGCNSALTWLYEKGYPVTHGFTVDQTPQMLNEWMSAPPVEYLVASTIHPHLLDHLINQERSLQFFHSYVGIKERPVSYGTCDACGATVEGSVAKCACNAKVTVRTMEFEDWLYAGLWKPTVRTGSGLNAVTRALDVAYFMGFAVVTVLGADCALKVSRPLPEGATFGTPEHKKWLEEAAVMHANGDSPTASGATPMTMDGEICPKCECKNEKKGKQCRHCKATCGCPELKTWHTKPDMAITAQFLAKMKQKLGPRLELVGDILPNAIVGKPEAYFDRLTSLLDKDGKPVRPS